jgi:Na+-transporting methylmalonyl-CoA/oxaloacetate decarboxylase gamma subunit
MVKRLLLRPLILLHRCFGVAFCLVFAMWFASGIVMHFVPFPASTESEHVAALLPINQTTNKVRNGHQPQERQISNHMRLLVDEVIK